MDEICHAFKQVDRFGAQPHRPPENNASPALSGPSRADDTGDSTKIIPVTSTLRLLLIEDSPDDAALVVRELTRGGYDVDCRSRRHA